jgi:hypothetical protein
MLVQAPAHYFAGAPMGLGREVGHYWKGRQGRLDVFTCEIR